MIKCENACPRGKFDGCCHKCPDFHTCPDSCQENPNACGSATFDEETALQEFKNTQLATLNAIASLTAHKKAIEEQEKEMKAKLYEAMVKFGVIFLIYWKGPPVEKSAVALVMVVVPTGQPELTTGLIGALELKPLRK